MLTYNIDVLQKLSDSGYTTYYLKQNKIVGQQTIQDLRTGKIIGTKSLEKICDLLQCQPGELIGWVPSEVATD